MLWNYGSAEGGAILYIRMFSNFSLMYDGGWLYASREACPTFDKQQIKLLKTVIHRKIQQN